VDYLTTGEIRNAANFPSVSTELLNVIQPYIALAEKMGKFEAQLASGGLKEVTVEYSGEILNYDVAPVTLSLLKGLLTPILTESINHINAPIIAKERGIKVIESKSSEIKDYTSMITLTVKTSKEVSSITGAIFGRHDPRIVQINKFSLDVIPEGHMLLLYNHDRPGVIGNIGTTLGENSVNIARLYLGREAIDKQSMVVLTTDTMVPEKTLVKLRNLPHVISVTTLEM
jgi:D-3-phosphoglycerate dehydrogenase